MSLPRQLSWVLLVVLLCAPWMHAALIQESNNVEQNAGLPKGAVGMVAVLGAVIAMLGGLWFVFARLKEKQQGFGPNSLKALGLILFLPTLLIVGVVVPHFKTETLAALLGTVAGYVLSHSKNEEG